MREGIHPDYKSDQGDLRLRRGHRDPLHARRLPHRDSLVVPPVLHGQAEDHGHRRPHRALQEPLRELPQGTTEKKAAPPPAPAPVKAAAKDENRATKRAKANAGKPKPAPKASPARRDPRGLGNPPPATAVTRGEPRGARLLRLRGGARLATSSSSRAASPWPSTWRRSR